MSAATVQQFVAVPLSTFRMMERTIKRIEKQLDERDKPKETQWLSARRFAALTGKNKEGLRYFRAKHPELWQVKEGQQQAYIYDYAGYKALND